MIPLMQTLATAGGNSTGEINSDREIV